MSGPKTSRAREPKLPRKVAVFAYPGVQVLDVTGPLEVFGQANHCLRERGRTGPDAYELAIIAPERGLFRSSSGIGLVADRSWREVRSLDTLLVAGGQGVEAQLDDLELQEWLRRMSRSTRRFGSACIGALLLARAGLLDGRRVTTHWESCGRLAAEHPRVRVDPDPIFIRDGSIYTSAGVTAGMDLALALIEEDHGRELALEVARQLVLFIRRPGGQSQFSAQLSAQMAQRDPLRELQMWMADHPDADLGVPALARRVAMSPRNFARVFEREVGLSPAQYVCRLRVEAARRRLEEGREGIEAIASACGFGTREAMRRSFLKLLHVSPTDYRARFQRRPEEARA